MVSDKAFTDRFNDRNSSGNRRLKENWNALFGGLFKNLYSSFSQQRLVPSHDNLTRLQGLHCKRVRNINPAHQFYENIDFRVLYQFFPISSDDSGRRRNDTIFFRILNRNPVNPKLESESLANNGTVLDEVFIDARSNVAQACQTDANPTHF